MALKGVPAVSFTELSTGFSTQARLLPAVIYRIAQTAAETHEFGPFENELRLQT